MCKVMAIAGIKKESVAQIEKFAKSMAKEMSWGDDDGVGYAAMTSTGAIYGEKWLKKEDAFVIHENPKVDRFVSIINRILGDAASWETPPTVGKVYDSFGERTTEAVSDTVALIMHARKATHGAKVIENVHPFVLPINDKHNTTALIHNGSITNHEKLTKTMSSCDSEVILHEYVKEDMGYNPWAINQMVKNLEGAYAVGVLGSYYINDQVVPYLDIFKHDKDLYAGYLVDLDVMVFCTSDWTMKNAAKSVDMEIKNIVKVKDGMLIRLDAITGNRMEDLIPFTPKSKTVDSYYSPKNRPAQTPVITQNDDDDDEVLIDEAKRQFERKHSNLFEMPVVDVTKPLSAAEQEYFDTLESEKILNHKALHLVKVALEA